MYALNPIFLAFTSSFKCLVPLDVIASGNSAIFFFLNKVTFLTSRKHFSFLLLRRKSNRVFLENLTSLFISVNLFSLIIFFKRRPSLTILLVNRVFIPIFFLLFSTICNVYFNFLFGSSDLENQTFLPLSSNPIIEPVFGQCPVMTSFL